MEPMERYSSEVSRTKRNAVECFVNTQGFNAQKNTFGTAPHFITIADSGILASDHYCIALGAIIEDHNIRRRGHQITFFDAMKPDFAIPAVLDFLNEMEVYHVYRIQVHDACDLDGKFALFTVLTAIWKMLEINEMGEEKRFSGEEKVFLHAVETVFKKHDLDRTTLNTLWKATVEKKTENLYFFYEEEAFDEPEEGENEEKAEEEDKSKIDITELREKYAILHVKTTIHSCEPSSKLDGSSETADALREAIQEEISLKDDTERKNSLFGGALTQMLFSHFMSRKRNAECSDTEAICANAIESCFATNKPAFDCRDGGMTLFIDKDLAEDEAILKIIGDRIFKLSGNETLTAKFRRIGVAVSADTVSEPDAEEYGMQEIIEISYRRIHEEAEELNASPVHNEEEEEQKTPKKEEMEDHEADPKVEEDQKVEQDMREGCGEHSGGKHKMEGMDEYDTEKKQKLEDASMKEEVSED